MQQSNEVKEGEMVRSSSWLSKTSFEEHKEDSYWKENESKDFSVDPYDPSMGRMPSNLSTHSSEVGQRPQPTGPSHEPALAEPYLSLLSALPASSGKSLGGRKQRRPSSKASKNRVLKKGILKKEILKSSNLPAKGQVLPPVTKL